MELFNGMSTNRVGKAANATALPAAFTRCKSARASQVLRMRAQTFHARPIMEVVRANLHRVNASYGEGDKSMRTLTSDESVS
jgi:hypothetical protein